MSDAPHPSRRPCGGSPRAGLPRAGFVALVLILCGAALAPFLRRAAERREAGHKLEQAARRVAPTSDPQSCRRLAAAWLLRPVLASWGDVGGCGVGGAATTGGGIKWVGRGVTGGLIDIQCTASQSFYPDGAEQLTFSTRLAHNLTPKWTLAANIPFRYNVEEVLDASDETRTAHLPGFGDVGLEVTRKLGITNAHSLTLSASFPSGAHDAVRHGVVLPQRMQLGNGTVSAGMIYEHTRDAVWGIMIFGGNLFYNGWENQIAESVSGGDFRGPTASAYMHLGYILGPFVPSAGLTVTGRFMDDRERGIGIGAPWAMIVPNLTIEWSSDWVALLLSASLPLSFENGIENWLVGVGVQTSLF